MTLWAWFVPVAAAVAAAAVLAGRRGAAALAIPLAGEPVPAGAARRPRAEALALAAALVALLAAAVALLPRGGDGFGGLLAQRRSTVVVLDVSASVSDLVYAEIARTLRGIVGAAGDRRIGLVLFSDTAQEALPPGTRAANLEPFVRFFLPKHEPGASRKPSFYRAAGPNTAPATPYPQNPWFRGFSGGTRISTGLAAAREALERDGGPGGRVVLLSDLAESRDDVQSLTGELVRYAGDPALDLRVVALPPATGRDTLPFERMLGSRGDLVRSSDLGGDVGGAPGGELPVAFVALAAAVALGLAVFEWRSRPLAWGAAGEGRR